MGSASSPRDVFPLDIAQFLIETHHLTPVASFAYLHLQIHCWRHGALPTEAEALASIAQIPVHAWSIAQASLKHLFSIGQDGLWHQAELDRRRAEWFGKHLRAKEKARKAANARWAKHWAQRVEHSPDVVHAQASAKHAQDFMHAAQMTEFKQDNNFKHGSPPSPLTGSPHTPFLDPSMSPLPGGGSRLPPDPPPPGTGARAGVMTVDPDSSDFLRWGSKGTWLLPEASDLAPDPALGEQHKSVNKAKPAILDRTGDEKSGDGDYPHPKSSASHRPPPGLRKRHSKKLSNLRFGSEGRDARFDSFSGEIFAYWSAQNPKGGECPWTPADRRALLGLLKGVPDMTLEEFKRLLHNRAESGLNPAALPRNWVGHIQEFAEGPLDRFKHLKHPGRVL